MTLTLGTNCGFVTTTPTADPAGTGTRTIDNYKRCCAGVTLASSATVIGMGWWCDNATEAGTYELGIYDDSTEDRLYVSTGNAKGTTSGWKNVTGLSWSLSAGTYLLALALTDTSTATSIDYQTGMTIDYYYTSGESTLPDPYGSYSTSAGSGLAIYALTSTVSYHITGVTKDKDGAVLGSCECFLFKDNGDNTLSFVAYQVSNASTGVYDFTGLADNDAAYLVYSVKDGSPNVFDVTDHVLQPVEE